MTVAKTIPKLMEMAVGMIACACGLVSNRIGNRPAAVVNDVRTIARKRAVPASSHRIAQPQSACARLVDEVHEDQAVVDDDAGQGHQTEHREHC